MIDSRFRRVATFFVAGWLGLSMVLIGGHAQAQAEPVGYREAIDEAVSEYGAGSFAEARALFTRAHALMPNARTLRGLGMTEFELRGYAESVRMLEAALASTVRPITGELRTQTEALLARARGFVGRFKVTLSPPSTQLLIDGAPAALNDGILTLAVGDHTLEARAEGHATIKQAMRITGGEDTTLNVALQKTPVATPAAVAAAAPASAPKPAATPATISAKPAATAASPPPKEDESSSLFASPWFWAAAGVVVVGAGVGVGIVVLGAEPEPADPYAGDTNVLLRGP